MCLCGYFMWICVGYLGYIRVTDAGIELVITSGDVGYLDENIEIFMVHLGNSFRSSWWICVGYLGYSWWICVGYLGYSWVTDAGIELVITSY